MQTMTGRYGPQTEHIDALIARARQLTAAEMAALRVPAATPPSVPESPERAAWRDAWGAAYFAAWSTGWADDGDIRSTDDSDLWYDVRDAAAAAIPRIGSQAIQYDAQEATGDVARSLLVRHLIGDRGLRPFTRAHYDALSRSWRTVVGPLHPEDPDLA